jgi:UDP-2,3-diacylglucosamine pyrophosphatase LpxH
VPRCSSVHDFPCLSPEREPFSIIQEVDTFIVSDLHLGTDLSRPTALLATLQRYSFRRLILLGDILDDLNFSRLPRRHWDLLAYVRTLCKPDRQIEVIWVGGNHDRLLSRITRNFLGLPVRTRYEWTYEGKTFLAMHGHQFDPFIERHPLITASACFLYCAIQRLEKNHHRLSHFLKHSSKTWLKVSDLVAQGAAAYAMRRGVDGIFCGHTHLPLARMFDGVTYHNTGCWTEKPATFITVGGHGINLEECP